MLERLKKLDLTAHNLNSQTIAAAIVLYLAVVVCCLWSVYDRNDRSVRRSVRLVWAFVIIFFPLVGVIAYLPFSLNHSSFSFSGFWRRSR